MHTCVLVPLLLVVALRAAVGELPKHWGQARFKGKRVLVTGGDSGIGFAAVQTFYLECARVLLVGHSNSKSRAAFEEVSRLPVPAQCADSQPAVAWAAADISNETDVARIIHYIVKEFGGLDVAVNNAGTDGNITRQIGEPGFLTPSGHLYDESIWDVNVVGTLKCMNAEIAHWVQAGSPGVIINIASIAGETAGAGPLYTSSKWAMIGFTKQAALHNAYRQIRINAVAPGAVNTTMLRGGLSPIDPRWIAKLAGWNASIPVGRIAEPWEMAGPISFLASDMASYANGLILTADGGLTQARPTSHQALPEQMAILSANASSSAQQLARRPTNEVAIEGEKQWGQPRFRGKRVLVTGGDSGIGLAAVQAFYLECARVLLVGHSSSKSQAASAEVRALGVPAQCFGSEPSVAWATADVSNASQVAAVMDRMLKEFGGLDIAVNNAGVGIRNSSQIGSPGFLTPSGDFSSEFVLDVNLGGTLKCMHEQIAYFVGAGIPGAIVNVASICGEVAYCPPLYGASKAAMISFSRQAALQYSRHGLRVNALAPGFVNTTMLRGGRSPADPAWLQERHILEAMVPSGRISEPWEMAGPITFLASDMASYVTGEVITVDGGVTMAGPFSKPRESDVFVNHGQQLVMV